MKIFENVQKCSKKRELSFETITHAFNVLKFRVFTRVFKREQQKNLEQTTGFKRRNQLDSQINLFNDEERVKFRKTIFFTLPPYNYLKSQTSPALHDLCSMMSNENYYYQLLILDPLPVGWEHQ